MEKLKEEEGVEVKALDDTPAILPHALLYWNAYMAVCRSRQWLEGRPMSIPLTEIEAYCRMKGFGIEHVETLLYVIDALEEAYFKWYAQFTKKQRSKTIRKPGKP